MTQKKELQQIVHFLLGQELDTADEQLAGRVTDKLISKVYSKDFDDFVQDEEAVATQFAEEIRQKKAYYDLCRDAGSPRV